MGRERNSSYWSMSKCRSSDSYRPGPRPADRRSRRPLHERDARAYIESGHAIRGSSFAGVTSADTAFIFIVLRLRAPRQEPSQKDTHRRAEGFNRRRSCSREGLPVSPYHRRRIRGQCACRL